MCHWKPSLSDIERVTDELRWLRTASPSWEANTFSSTQILRRFIIMLKITLHFYLFWATWIQFTTCNSVSWRCISILSSNLRLGRAICFFPSRFHTPKPCMHFLSLIRATRPAQFHYPFLSAQIILVEEYISRSSSLCSFLHSPGPSSEAQTSSSAPHSRTPSACVLLTWQEKGQGSHHIQQQAMLCCAVDVEISSISYKRQRVPVTLVAVN